MSNRNGVWSLAAQYQAIADQDWTMAPGAPTGVSATAGNAQAEVSFTAPTFAGIPGTITQFKVTSSSGQTATGSASPITVTGLTNGNAVTFTAQAQNAIGLGKASAASSSVTPLAEVISGLFSTYLYDGNGSSQTITNGINLSGKGGLVWTKARNVAFGHNLFDTERGFGTTYAYRIFTNETNAQSELTDGVSSFNSNGFSVGNSSVVNGSSYNYATWTFRKEPKFFDVVTYTGTGVNGRTVSHNLGAAPGMIIVKQTSASGESWYVYHRSTGATKRIYLNSTAAAATNDDGFYDTEPTSTEFTVAYNGTNKSGESYVAYLFAHNDGDGGFGPDSEDIIKCGSFSTDSSGNATINLGFEPQFVINKTTSSADNWTIADSMRGFNAIGDQRLYANLANAEAAATTYRTTSTGFTVNSGETSKDFIYMAIRRPDQSIPTTATDVFDVNEATNPRGFVTTGFPVDLHMQRKLESGDGFNLADRLRGENRFLYTTENSSEYTFGSTFPAEFDHMNGIDNYSYSSQSGKDTIFYNWKRAPGFFDMVAYTGTTNSPSFPPQTLNHNLGAVPEMMWIKCRSTGGSSTYNWTVYHKDVGNTKALFLNETSAPSTGTAYWNNTTPTATQFTVGGGYGVNQTSQTYIAYLFATVAGVSKVGSFTGTTSDLTIDCGFSSGARFVLIKLTSGSGDWVVWDSTRGIVSGNDPYLLLNSTAAEVTNTDFIDPHSSGFTVTAGYQNNLSEYIFYAIA